MREMMPSSAGRRSVNPPAMHWCKACQKFHAKVRNREHHAALKCKAPYDHWRKRKMEGSVHS